MNLIVKKDFIDKETNEKHKEGEKLKVEKSVGERLLKSPYKVVEEIKKEAKEQEEE